MRQHLGKTRHFDIDKDEVSENPFLEAFKVGQSVTAEAATAADGNRHPKRRTVSVDGRWPPRVSMSVGEHLAAASRSRSSASGGPCASGISSASASGVTNAGGTTPASGAIHVPASSTTDVAMDGDAIPTPPSATSTTPN